MTYDEAIAAVENGMYAWRHAWAAGSYIHLNGTQIYMYPADAPYAASTSDQQATDWFEGDRPPH
jgi:hypothetical protein